MSVRQMSELERKQEELELKRIAGKTNNIEINERTLEAFRQEFRKKGLEPESKDYPPDDFVIISKLKEFDRLVDPSQGIKKVIGSMVRQPVTVFNKQGKPEIKDALYYSGYYYGVDKRANDLGAEFQNEGCYKRPRLVFTATDPANPFDPKTGERRGSYKQSGGAIIEHYIFLPEKKEDRVKFLNDIIEKATGTYPGNLSIGGHLSYRNPSPNNDHSGTHGGSFTWQVFTELSLEGLGELQNKNYYTEKSTGAIKYRTGQRVAYDHSTKKVETTTGR
jgi:hypothetical protein